MTSPHPPERASATLRAICLHSVVRGRATGRCVSSFRNPLFAWSGSRSRIHFSVGCASLTRSNGLRTAFERFPAARAVRTALQLTRRAERNSFSRDARFQFLAESVRLFPHPHRTATEGHGPVSFPEFEGFQKIPRLKRSVVISEKIDGTNAQVFVGEDGAVLAGSRSRWITPEDDNFGFARWVADHADELRELGPGRHFGEWWGAGIQRRYGLTEKRFSLFNSARWADARPACCHVVPVLYEGQFNTDAVEAALGRLAMFGSVAAPGFMKPEGIVVYVAAARQLFKVTLEKDEEPKSLSQAA